MQIVDVCRIGHQYCFGGTPHSRSRGSGSDSTRYPFDSRETPQPPGFLEDIFPSILHPPPPSSITSWKSRYSGRSFASAFSAYPFRRSRTVSFAVLDPRAGSGTFSFFPTRLSISVPDPPLSTNASARVVSAVYFFLSFFFFFLVFLTSTLCGCRSVTRRCVYPSSSGTARRR